VINRIRNRVSQRGAGNNGLWFFRGISCMDARSSSSAATASHMSRSVRGVVPENPEFRYRLSAGSSATQLARAPAKYLTNYLLLQASTRYFRSDARGDRRVSRTR
jgi:hypothetical protein